MKRLTIYHGSETEIKYPLKEKGKPYNDYGQGFYCTEYKEQAAEWACKLQHDGIVNQYTIDLKNLKVLYLNDEYHILNWLAILVDNRRFTDDITLDNVQYIKEKYLINYKQYDVIIGYRADDAYYRFVREFLNNTIGVHTLNEAMYLGKLGLQIFIQSERAFKQLTFESSEPVDQETHFINYFKNIEQASKDYDKKKKSVQYQDQFIIDMRRGDIDEDSIPKIRIK